MPQRPILKYIDPVSGKYEYSTVVDIGDLDKLNTRVKDNLVNAINSILADGVPGEGGGSVPDGVLEELNK